jgi:protein SCO1/2
MGGCHGISTASSTRPRSCGWRWSESGQGHIGSLVDELLLYCYHYDPASGRYGAMVMNLVRIGGVLTVVLMGGFIVLMRRQEKMHPRTEGHA